MRDGEFRKLLTLFFSFACYTILFRIRNNVQQNAHTFNDPKVFIQKNTAYQRCVWLYQLVGKNDDSISSSITLKTYILVYLVRFE